MRGRWDVELVSHIVADLIEKQDRASFSTIGIHAGGPQLIKKKPHGRDERLGEGLRTVSGDPSISTNVN